MANEKILLIDDSTDILENLSEYLRNDGYEVDTAANGESGISMIEKKYYDIVLTDLMMPSVDGMEVLKYVTKSSPDSICIILTGYGTVKNAVEAMKLGAYQYLSKPLMMDEILVTLQKALDHRNLKAENMNLRDQLKKKYKFENIIGDSEKMRQIFEIIEKVADTDSTILILGERGTGKELIAKSIHYNSYRREGPFVPVNCAAIPSELLESELFGHEKGAFTNAIRTRIGRFELANAGTVFLDEIGDMSPNLQSKLLRVLQERQFERVGGVKTVKIDIRVIAATHQDLKAAVQGGTFRQDLYYRLNVIPMEVPPLRERISDIPLLVNHFLAQFNKSKKRQIQGIDHEALNLMTKYHWPGNVRELENIIERSIALETSNIVLPENLFLSGGLQEVSRFNDVEMPNDGIDLNEEVAKFERHLIEKALKKAKGSKTKAADILRVSFDSLRYRIEKLGISID